MGTLASLIVLLVFIAIAWSLMVTRGERSPFSLAGSSWVLVQLIPRWVWILLVGVFLGVCLTANVGR